MSGPHASSPVNPAAATSSTSSTASHTPSGTTNYTAATPISSVGDLQQKAPDLYNAMMQGIALSIIAESQHHQDRIHQMNEEANSEAFG